MDLAKKKQLIQDIANKHEFHSLNRIIEEKFLEDTISIALVGEFSAGKSTIANALLGRELLPSFEDPTTAAIVEIVVGQELKAAIEVGGETKDIELTDSINYIVEKHQDVGKVIITSPENEFLRKGIKIIDTPGIDSIENTHKDITFGYLPFVDAILLVLNINKGGMTDSLRTFLKQKIIDENDLKKVSILLNWSDTKSQKEIDFVIKNVRQGIKDILHEPTIIALSGKQALVEGTADKSNIDELKEVINTILLGKKDFLDRQHTKFLVEKKRLLVQLLNEKMSFKDMDDSALEDKITDSKKRIEEFENIRRFLLAQKRQFEKNINNEIDRQLTLYCDQLISATMDNDQSQVSFSANAITKGIKAVVDREVANFNFPLIDDKDYDVSLIINNQIDSAIGKWRETIDTISPIITALIIAGLTGSPGLTMSETSLETIVFVLGRIMKNKDLDFLEELNKEMKNKKDNSSHKETENREQKGNGQEINTSTEEKNSNIKKGLKLVGSLISQLDLANKGMKIAVKKLKKGQIKDVLATSLKGSVRLTLTDLFRQIDNHMKRNVIEPQKEFEKILEDTRSERKNKYNEMTEIKKDIEKDINNLNMLL